MSDKLKAVTDATFDQEVIKSTKPVLVDFWAPWCSPCRALTPILEELESQYADRISFVKMNIDENPKTPAQYSVMSIPTLIIIKNGQVEATRVGLPQKSDLSAFIESNS